MMKASEVMTPHVATCKVATPLPEVARLMVEHDCGEIPVLDDAGKPIGVVTDRDICCRTVALARNPLVLQAAECMSSPCVTMEQSASLEQCLAVMQRYMIRRVPVVDSERRCVGLIAQADIAKLTSMQQTAGVVRTLSQNGQGS